MGKDIYSKIYQTAIKSRLNICFYKNRLLSKNFFDDYSLKNITIHIIDKCNLNCAYCDNFSPLAQSDNLMSLEIFEKITKRLKELAPNISFFNIGGGEPLLHPQILDICKMLRLYYEQSVISIMSNGILLENYNDTFVSTLCDYNIFLVVTKYPIKLDYYKQSRLYNKAKSIYTVQLRKQMYNLQLHSSKIDNSYIYYNCNYSGYTNYKKNTPRCIHIDKNGNLFFCALIQNIQLLEQYFNIKFEKIKGKYGDYINLFEIDNIEDILYGINNKIPFCDYCNLPKLVDWKISKRELSEWCVIDKK